MSAYLALPFGLIRSSFVALIALLLPGALLVAAEGTAANDSLYSRLLHSTALVLAPDGSGSAWVADRERGLLVTNYHVVAKNDANELHDTVTLVFPEYQDGRAIAERSYYTEHRDQLMAKGRVLQGRVLDALEEVDLALIQVDRLPDDVTAVRLASQSPSPEDNLHSIGNPGDSDALWLDTKGSVKQVSKSAWAVQLGKRLMRMAARTVITQAPTNPGDSGGPVVNDEGQLVAVTEGGSTAATLINCAIDVTEVRAYLEDTSWMTRVRTANDYARRARYYFRNDRNEWSREAHVAQHNRPRLALSDFDEAIRLDSSEADLYVDRAIVLERLGEWDSHAVLSHFKIREDGSGFSEFNRAIADCNAAIRLAPRQGRARVVLADLRLPIARRSQFGSSDMTALLLSPPLMAPQDSAAAWSAYDAAQASRKQDILDAVALDRDCIEAYEILAIETNDPTQAIGYINEIIRRQPDNAAAIALRAAKYAAQKNYDAALADLSKAIRIKPAVAGFYRSRAAIYSELKQYAEAIADRLVIAKGLDPEDTLNLKELGDTLVIVKHYDDAVAIYSEALGYIEKLSLPNAQPENILLARGDAKRAKGNVDDARHDYRLAIKMQHDPFLIQGALFIQEVKERLKSLPAASEE